MAHRTPWVTLGSASRIVSSPVVSSSPSTWFTFPRSLETPPSPSTDWKLETGPSAAQPGHATSCAGQCQLQFCRNNSALSVSVAALYGEGLGHGRIICLRQAWAARAHNCSTWICCCNTPLPAQSCCCRAPRRRRSLRSPVPCSDKQVRLPAPHRHRRSRRPSLSSSKAPVTQGLCVTLLHRACLSFWGVRVWLPQTKCDTEPSAKMQAEDSKWLGQRAAHGQDSAGMQESCKNSPICRARAGDSAMCYLEVRLGAMLFI